MQERRRYVRTNGLVLVNYKIPEIHLEGKSSAFDICAGGLRIIVGKKLENGTAIEVEVYLPGNSQPILAKGEVAWSQESKNKIDVQFAPKKKYFDTGIKFTVMDENNKKRIIGYVHRKLGQAK